MLDLNLCSQLRNWEEYEENDVTVHVLLTLKEHNDFSRKVQ